jgi:hypothetical protein
MLRPSASSSSNANGAPGGVFRERIASGLRFGAASGAKYFNQLSSATSSSSAELPTSSSSAPMYSSSSAPTSSFASAYDNSLSSFTAAIRVLEIISAFAAVVALITLPFTGAFALSVVLAVCVGSLRFCEFLVNWIFSKDTGTQEMQVISDAIKEGSEGFLQTQYTAIAYRALAVSGVLFVLYMFRATPANMRVSRFAMASLTAISFISGAACSGLAGFIGVWISVRVNIRVASAAARYSYQDALMLSFRGGAVSSVLSAASCILGLSILYVFTHLFMIFIPSQPIELQQLPILLTGYGFGASFVALFMQLAGGIYTKAADVGADMVGKIEKDIPEDDQRNPAVVADLVGDNVGDCAGSMADVFESIAAEIIGTMILGGSLASESKLSSPNGFIFFPLIVHALDLVISGIGIILVKNATDNEVSRCFVFLMISHFFAGSFGGYEEVLFRMYGCRRLCFHCNNENYAFHPRSTMGLVVLCHVWDGWNHVFLFIGGNYFEFIQQCLTYW